MGVINIQVGFKAMYKRVVNYPQREQTERSRGLRFVSMEKRNQ